MRKKIHTETFKDVLYD